MSNSNFGGSGGGGEQDESGLRDNSMSIMDEESIEFTSNNTTANSPMSLSSCARLVQNGSKMNNVPNKIKSASSCKDTNYYFNDEEKHIITQTSRNKSHKVDAQQQLYSSPSNSALGCKLDLPMVYNNLKVDNFRGTKRESCLVHKVRSKQELLRDTVNKMRRMSLNENQNNLHQEQHSQCTDFISLPGLGNSFKVMINKKLPDANSSSTSVCSPSTRSGSNSNHSSTTATLSEEVNSPSVTTGRGKKSRSKLMLCTKSMQTIKKKAKTTTNSRITNPSNKYTIENGSIAVTDNSSSATNKSFGAEKLCNAFNWAREHAILKDEALAEIYEDWKSYTKKEAKSVSFQEISDLLVISQDDLFKFKLFGVIDEQVLSLRNIINHLAYPDLLKMKAFSEWQQGNFDKCVYHVSESHGTHLRNDITDKHCLYFNTKEEKAAHQKLKQEKNNKVMQDGDSEEETLKSKVFLRQITDAIYFGKTQEDFETKINYFKPDWNVIQLSALSFGNNRFFTDITDWKETPPLFLTSFQQLPHDKKRSSFCTFVKQPDIIPGALMHKSILEEFNKVMINNRHINDGYQGCRKRYWDIRAEHNKCLQDVLNAIEENWIFPWTFLFPGNIKDPQIQSKLITMLGSVEEYAGKPLAVQERIVLYKLTENFQVVDDNTKSSLVKFLSFLLNISSTRAKRISYLITALGNQIEPIQNRGPTILILDQELEQLPWDWLPILKKTETSVTRMPSVAAIYSSLKVMKYPEIIDMMKCSYILNPDQTLKNVQARLEEYLKDRIPWNGAIGRKPLHHEVEEALQYKDCLIYCGHGSGVGFYPEFALQKILCNATPILMGCSSGQYKYNGPKASSSSIINSYMIAASPSMVGFLWEVTDVECDRVTVDLIQRWLPSLTPLPSFAQFDPHLHRPREKCLATAVLRARKAATQFLTEAALVNYGLPIETK